MGETGYPLQQHRVCGLEHLGLSSLGNQRPATTTITISHSITGGEADEVADLSVGDATIADLFGKRRRKALAKAKGKGKKAKSKVALLADAAGMASPLTPLQAHAARVRAGRAEVVQFTLAMPTLSPSAGWANAILCDQTRPCLPALGRPCQICPLLPRQPVIKLQHV